MFWEIGIFGHQCIDLQQMHFHLSERRVISSSEGSRVLPSVSCSMTSDSVHSTESLAKNIMFAGNAFKLVFEIDAA